MFQTKAILNSLVAAMRAALAAQGLLARSARAARGATVWGERIVFSQIRVATSTMFSWSALASCIDAFQTILALFAAEEWRAILVAEPTLMALVAVVGRGSDIEGAFVLRDLELHVQG